MKDWHSFSGNNDLPCGRCPQSVLVDCISRFDMPDVSSSGVTETSPLLSKATGQGERPASGADGSAQVPSDDVESSQPAEEAEDPEVAKGRKRIQRLLPVLGIGIFLAYLDQSIVAAINGEIGNDLHALENASWIATAYFLTMTASQPLYGKISDVFGRKPCLLFAYTMFGIGSIGCGLTNNMEGFIAARVSYHHDKHSESDTENSRQSKVLEEVAS